MDKFALDDPRVYAMAEQLADLVWDVVIAWEPFVRMARGRSTRCDTSCGARTARRLFTQGHEALLQALLNEQPPTLNAYLRSLGHEA